MFIMEGVALRVSSSCQRTLESNTVIYPRLKDSLTADSIIINIAIIISQDDEISCSYYQLGILFMILPVAIAILFFTALLVGANIFRKIRTLRKKL